MSDVTGGCRCRKVRFVASGDPYRVGLCHCMDCRKHHGALFHASAVFPQSAVTIEGETGAYEGRYFCPHCGAVNIYHFADNRTHKCGRCRNRFSIKVGTIFEDSKIGLDKWLMAIRYLTCSKDGTRSSQLSRDLGITQKSAWLMLRRLQQAAETRSFNRPLGQDIPPDLKRDI